MENIETAQARHKKEQKHLQGRVIQKKKNATKKTRKGVNDECDKLEQELKERQHQELASLSEPTEGVPGGDDDEAHHSHGTLNEAATISESIPPDATPPIPGETRGPKRNRQKERLGRRAAEAEAQSLAAAAEASNLPDHKQFERTSMLSAIAAHRLTETEIPPDGHCLFNALATSLESVGIPLQRTSSTVSGRKTEPKYKIVRAAAAEYMEENREDFEAFVDEEWEGYVRKIRDTAEWGGQLELMAVARRFGVEIKVLRDGGIERFEPGAAGDKEVKTIWVAYYRHGYGLGEHYNSLQRHPS